MDQHSHPYIKGPIPGTMQEYRKFFRGKRQEFFRNLPDKIPKILDIIQIPRAVDMKEIEGTDLEVAAAIDQYFAFDGRFLDPKMSYPPSMIDHFGKDYALNAQGIYYFDHYSPDLVICNRKVWIPTLECIDWEEPGQTYWRKRARDFAQHSMSNEGWNKSEYAWEADAWSDVFSDLRNDPALALDKHDYFIRLPKTDPISCTLTGESTVVKRTPDATFGLATFSERQADIPVWAHELLGGRLEKLLLHRKCGLISDPKWGETNLVFPFAVYEAKGWGGDYRKARHQACLAAASYLDLLDDLARTPGPVGSAKKYQTATSHQYQVFVLTSFGAHWHLLVGYRRPRQADEHGGVHGMSETVYVFQKVWSGRVVTERAAWELLSLVEQIHLWAITEFRDFVLEHLRPWHTFCEENYLLDWDSVYDSGRQKKRKRNCNESEDLLLPSWVDLMSEPIRQNMQARAKESLAKALERNRLKKGKDKCTGEPGWVCMIHECSISQETEFCSNEVYLDHIRRVHGYTERDLAQIRRCIDEADEENLSGSVEDFSIGSNLSQRKKIKVR